MDLDVDENLDVDLDLGLELDMDENLDLAVELDLRLLSGMASFSDCLTRCVDGKKKMAPWAAPEERRRVLESM